MDGWGFFCFSLLLSPSTLSVLALGVTVVEFFFFCWGFLSESDDGLALFPPLVDVFSESELLDSDPDVEEEVEDEEELLLLEDSEEELVS